MSDILPIVKELQAISKFGNVCINLTNFKYLKDIYFHKGLFPENNGKKFYGYVDFTRLDNTDMYLNSIRISIDHEIENILSKDISNGELQDELCLQFNTICIACNVCPYYEIDPL